MKLSKRKIKQIEAWLRRDNHGRKLGCPFKYDSNVYNNICRDVYISFKICKKAFPKVRFTDIDVECPCDTYSLNHVIRKAKKMVETGEV